MGNSVAMRMLARAAPKLRECEFSDCADVNRAINAALLVIAGDADVTRQPLLKRMMSKTRAGWSQLKQLR
jgi:hypothetical protein